MENKRIEIEKHTSIDGDYYLIIINGRLFAKTWTLSDAEKIKYMFE